MLGFYKTNQGQTYLENQNFQVNNQKPKLNTAKVKISTGNEENIITKLYEKFYNRNRYT